MPFDRITHVSSFVKLANDEAAFRADPNEDEEFSEEELSGSDKEDSRAVYLTGGVAGRLVGEFCQSSNSLFFDVEHFTEFAGIEGHPQITEVSVFLKNFPETFKSTFAKIGRTEGRLVGCSKRPAYPSSRTA